MEDLSNQSSLTPSTEDYQTFFDVPSTAADESEETVAEDDTYSLTPPCEFHSPPRMAIEEDTYPASISAAYFSARSHKPSPDISIAADLSDAGPVDLSIGSDDETSMAPGFSIAVVQPEPDSDFLPRSNTPGPSSLLPLPAIGRSSQASSTSRRSARSPAHQRWIDAGRRVGVAAKVVNALRPQESKYFSLGRILSRIVVDNCLYWPMRDVRCQLADSTFSSYLTMIDWKRTLGVAPLHMVEDILENFVDEREELEGRRSGGILRKAKYEIAMTLLAFGVCHIRQRIVLGTPLFASPLSFLNGALARILSIAPFIGGYDALVPFPVQATWLVVMFKPLNVICAKCCAKNLNDLTAVRQLYGDYGWRGFFSGVFADFQACGSSFLGHLLADFNVPTAHLGAGLAISGALWKRGPGYLSDFGYLAATGITTALMKKAIHAYFGDAPKRASMSDVLLTKEFLENKEIASGMTARLSKRAQEEEFYADVKLEEKADDEESIGMRRTVSVVTIAHTVSGFLRHATRGSRSYATAAYVSGLHGDLYLINGRYDVELDPEGNPMIENGRPRYHRMLHVEISDEDEELPTDDYTYIRYIVLGDVERWALVDQDRVSILAFCNDPAVYPFQCKATWSVVNGDSCSYMEDSSFKISREPTPFLHRMNVFSVLNHMLDMDGPEEDELDRAVEPAEYFCLRVRRSCLAKSSLQAVLGGLPSDLVAHEFSVEFKGEYGMDYGGLSREWFSLLAAELSTIDDLEMQLWDMKIDREGPWFVEMPDKSLLPVEGAPVQFYLAIGRLLAMSLIHGSFFPLPLSFVIFKYILETPICAEDFKELDPDFFKHRLSTLLKPGGAQLVADILGENLTFISAASPTAVGGQPLLYNGENMDVTEENKMEYAHLLAEEYLCANIRQQLQALVTGFWDLCPRQALSAMKASDLKGLTVGPDEPFDVAVFARNAKCESSVKDPIQFQWFLQAVSQLSREESVRFLQFFTGACRMPREGLKPPFTLVINNAWQESQLPTAHTCANTVCIPAYPDFEMLNKKLRTALEFYVGFGFE